MSIVIRPARPGVILMALAILGIALAPLPTPSAELVDRHIRVDASRFEYTPAVISANPGDRVTIELVARDVVHGLYVDGYDVSLTADPGRPARITFTADRSGTFRFRCSVTCGPLHPFMIGKLNVGPNGLWWRAAGLAVVAALASLFWSRDR